MSETADYLVSFDPERIDHVRLLDDAAKDCDLGAFGLVIRLRRLGIEVPMVTAYDALTREQKS